MVSFPAGILPELQHHLDTYSLDGPDGLVFVNEHGRPWHRGNFDPAVRWREAREQIGVPNLHLHDLRIPATHSPLSRVPACATW
ncbi:MAG TPA: hypothetical protein VI094_12475 [Propionibacteriaceae bacterium]